MELQLAAASSAAPAGAHGGRHRRGRGRVRARGARGGRAPGGADCGAHRHPPPRPPPERQQAWSRGESRPRLDFKNKLLDSWFLLQAEAEERWLQRIEAELADVQSAIREARVHDTSSGPAAARTGDSAAALERQAREEAARADWDLIRHWDRAPPGAAPPPPIESEDKDDGALRRPMRSDGPRLRFASVLFLPECPASVSAGIYRHVGWHWQTTATSTAFATLTARTATNSTRTTCTTTTKTTACSTRCRPACASPPAPAGTRALHPALPVSRYTRGWLHEHSYERLLAHPALTPAAAKLVVAMRDADASVRRPPHLPTLPARFPARGKPRAFARLPAICLAVLSAPCPLSVRVARGSTEGRETPRFYRRELRRCARLLLSKQDARAACACRRQPRRRSSAPAPRRSCTAHTRSSPCCRCWRARRRHNTPGLACWPCPLTPACWPFDVRKGHTRPQAVLSCTHRAPRARVGLRTTRACRWRACPVLHQRSSSAVRPAACDRIRLRG